MYEICCDAIFSTQIVRMETSFCMMAVHYPLITPMELYLFVLTMCMVLCVMTSGTLWMPLLCVLSLASQHQVSVSNAAELIKLHVMIIL